MTALIYIAAALAEIGGCFAFWAWLRLGKPILWIVPGTLSLLVFAYLLTLVPSDAAGRAFAAYGGVYIVASLAWLWTVEGVRPDRWDVGGAALCLIGAAREPAKANAGSAKPLSFSESRTDTSARMSRDFRFRMPPSSRDWWRPCPAENGADNSRALGFQTRGR